MALGDANRQVLLHTIVPLQAQRTAGAGAGAVHGRCRADLGSVAAGAAGRAHLSERRAANCPAAPQAAAGELPVKAG
jgi:hypothetical protein